jgi:hypothetical protein
MNVTIKLATDADRDRIRRLAELDSRAEPHGDVLLAEVQGRLVAAIGMDGTVVADPFERTAGVIKLLRAQVEPRPERLSTGLLTRLFSRPAGAGRPSTAE